MLGGRHRHVRGKESESVEYAHRRFGKWGLFCHYEHDSRLGDANLKSYLNDDSALVERWPCVGCTVELYAA